MSISKKIIPYSKQEITKEDINQVVKVLKSDFITQGNKNIELEKKISNFVSSKYAVAVNSATSALHLSCLALNLKKNDIVWTSPISFVSSSNCALMCGATVDFVDIDPDTINIDTKKLKDKLKKAKLNKILPKILIVVHMAGLPCDMFAIKKLANIYKFKIIEDASHALNSYYEKDIIGSCVYSDIAVFSFHAVKIITSGEGGMAVTNNKKYYEKIHILRSHGITRDYKKFLNKNLYPWYYEQHLLGFNYRLTEFQAALALSQLKQIKNNTKKRYKLFNLYNRLLKDNALRKKNILVNLHYIPIHLHPFYKKLGFKKGDFPVAENYYLKALSLPLYPSLSIKNLEYIVNIIKKLL